MISLFTITGRSLVVPLHTASCVAAQDDPFTVVERNVEDPLTEVLWDEPGALPVDWWNTGKESSWDVNEYVKDWRRYEARKRVSPFIQTILHSQCPSPSVPIPHSNSCLSLTTRSKHVSITSATHAIRW